PCVSAFGYNITLPWSSGTNGFLGIKAELANVQWIGSGKSAAPSFAVPLGQSNSSVVLYDIDRRTVLIIPEDQDVVSPRSNLTGSDDHEELRSTGKSHRWPTRRWDYPRTRSTPAASRPAVGSYPTVMTTLPLACPSPR